MSGKQQGFTLIELIMVIILLGVLSAVGIGLLPSSDQYTARLAADKWLTFFRLGQRMALIKQNASDLVTLTINQNANQWQASLLQGSDVLQQSEFDREEVDLKFSTSDFSSACSDLASVSFPQTFYFDGNGDHVTVARAAINSNVRICLVGGGQQQELCLSPSGYIYSNTCVP